MKKIVILLVVLAAVIATALVFDKIQNEKLNTAASRGIRVREFLLPDLAINDVAGLHLKDKDSEVTVNISEDRQTASVVERGGYPASTDRLASVLRDLQEQKIASKQIVGKGAWKEVEVVAPGEGNEGVGTLVELKAAGGKQPRTFILGKQLDVAGGRSSTQFSGGSQRFVRLPTDGETIWVISNTYYDLEAKPESWLDKAFIDVQKLKEVSVTHPRPEDSWAVSRPDENAHDFTLLNAKPGEGLDPSKLSVSTLLSSPTFNDVHTKDKAGELLKDAAKVKIVTFDGFTYDLQVAKQSKDGSDKHYLTVDVSASIPQSREAAKDEKEEDKKKKDDEFANRKKTLEEKLAKEKRFSGWIFEVSEYTVNNLLKKRSDIVKVVAPADAAPDPAPGAGSAPAPAPAAPPPAPAPAPTAPPAAAEAPPSAAASPASAVTPPVPLPSAPKVEVKPAPDANANPATGEAPPPPAPAAGNSAPKQE
jgi:hypothetical protein